MAAPITPEDLYRFRWIDHARLSPDGERVAYQVSWADAASRQNRSRIVVRRLLDPEPVEPTAGVQRDHSPEWSPDGRSIAFVSKVGAADQLFVLDVTTGGPPLQLSSVPDGVGLPHWSPDGQKIAFLGAVLADAGAVVDDPRQPEGREQLRRAPVARVVRRLDYKHDGRGFVDGRYHHLFSVPAAGGEAKQLTDGAWDVSDYDWSPDSNRIVVAGNAEPGADLQRELNLYLVDQDAKRVRLGGGFLISTPIWSPKGDLIAFIAPNGLDVGLIERLWVVPLAGGGPRCLTLDLDQAVNDSVINDMRSGHVTRLKWSDEGDRIYFAASGPGVTAVKSVDLEGSVREEVGGRRRVYDFDVAGGVLVFCASDPGDPGNLHMLTKGAEARVTDLNPWLHDRYVAEPEQQLFTAPDGWKLEGWLLKPANFDSGRVYPTVVEIHGGPHAQYGWSFFHELQILAGMGFVVFYMNPRGSDGYGETFRRSVVRDWGGKDYVDLMSSIDQVIQRAGYIDSKRLGVGGGSYGGFMTNWIIGQTDRFAAAVSMRSISNLVSEYAQHDIVLWGVLQLGPPPWPDLDELWRRSPIRYVKNVRTPLLLTAGEMDLRCAMSQSEELFGALRLLGKTVELVRFPEESHDLSRGGRPDRRVERLKRIAGWYEKYLGTASAERPPVEEATQTLEVPAEAAREWAKTVAISSKPIESVPVTEEPAAAPAAEERADGEEPAAEESAAVEPAPAPMMDLAAAEVAAEVVQPTVPEFATAAAPIVEPEALPDLPAPGDPATGVVPELKAEPAPPVAESEPVVEAEAAPLRPILSPEAEREEAAPLTPTLFSEAESEEAAPLTPTLSSEAESEEAAALTPTLSSEGEREEEAPFTPSLSHEGEREEEPEPQPEPGSAVAEPMLSGFEERVVAPASEPEPEPQPVAAQTLPDIESTLVSWPGAAPTAPPQNGPPAEPSSFEEATSVIPAWQQTDPNADSKRTVSLQAMPAEEVSTGSGYAALLTFESGPFAGRIVALPNHMISVGRAPDNDVVVGDPATSGHHGRIEVRSGSFWISDLGSTNGTLVNGDPVIEKQLADGDLIAIGQNTLRFTLEA
jgi:dipeptidyl aminopeptidase/acylaminoacyl peptidase